MVALLLRNAQEKSVVYLCFVVYIQTRESINFKRRKTHLMSHFEDQCCHLNTMVTKNAGWGWLVCLLLLLRFGLLVWFLGFVELFFCVCLCFSAFAVLFGIYQLNGEEKSPGETLADSGWRLISNIL